ncbi:hypothetical protein KCP71_08265 [Salmonella enterica subsp. enterica]|nr:hypothetical protein KCP71_08265 [Salmonella enterica subsp. enterica]
MKSVALITAGGRGASSKRFSEQTRQTSRPLWWEVPLIDFALSNCLNSGIRRIGVIAQCQSHTLVQHIQRGWSLFSEG